MGHIMGDLHAVVLILPPALAENSQETSLLGISSLLLRLFKKY